MSEYKYTDKNHPPVPLLKVGDICYAHCQWGVGAHYADISKCEIRKVEVKWCEPSDYDKERGEVAHWIINYFIRSDIDEVGLKSTKMYSYSTDEEGGRLKSLYFTPQEVMDENIEDFLKSTYNIAKRMRSTMKKLGYSQEKINCIDMFAPKQLEQK